MANNRSGYLHRLLVVATALLIQSAAFADDAEVEFNIESQELGAALNEFALQSGKEILFIEAETVGKSSPNVSGAYEPTMVLELLLADARLDYRINELDTVLVGAVADKGSEAPGKSQPASSQVLMAQNQTSAQQTQTSRNNETADEKAKSEIPLEEIIVTGSKIRGVKNDSSPIFIYDREDIDESGFSSLPRFIQSLPQVFNSHSEIAASSGGETTLSNFGHGAAVNLRGLGTGATLTLLNGHRLVAPGGDTVADISMIPLAAVERVEMLTDGASAIYGSDAIAGVVNFILRDKFDGAETRLRYGNSTEGGGEELQFSQAFGKSWNSANVMLAYEHYDRDSLDSSDRSFAKDSLQPTDLLPSQNLDSIFLTARQELSNRIELFGDAFYSDRKSRQFSTTEGFVGEPASNVVDAQTESIGATMGVTIELADSWQAEFVAAYNRTELGFDATNTRLSDGVVVFSNTATQTSKIWSVNGMADGTLFRLPGGDVKVAVGGDFYKDRFIFTTLASGNDADTERDVMGLFGQLFIPLVGEGNGRPGIERLEVNYSIRYEDYSDFGDTTNWKVGLLWSPVNGLNVRGSYGTSFRAPRFRHLEEAQTGVLFFNLPDTFFLDPPSPTGTFLTLLASGPNPTLQPETSTQFTAGFDIQPPSNPNLKVSLTYFDIEYRDKIARISGSIFSRILDPDLQFLVDRTPDPDLMVFLLSLPLANDFSGGADPRDTDIFLDDRLRNLTVVNTSGVDLTASYNLDTSLGRWGFTLGGTYLTEQDEQIRPGDIAFSTLNQVESPIDLRLRGGVSWNNGRNFSANTLVSYVDSYQDTRVGTEGVVDSWTTVNFNIQYKLGDRSVALFKDMVLSLNTQNLFDSDPPFVQQPLTNVNLDTRNSTPLGRFVSFNIVKKW